MGQSMGICQWSQAGNVRLQPCESGLLLAARDSAVTAHERHWEREGWLPSAVAWIAGDDKGDPAWPVFQCANGMTPRAYSRCS